MSAFDPVTLPEDFRLDLVESEAQHRTPEQCVVQGDFEATIFRLAVHDDAVYQSLCKAMPPGACAAIYFDKVQERSRKLLADFDRYCRTGSAPTATAAAAVPLDVNDVIEQLRDHVARIQRNIVMRAPHGSEGAAKALVTLLEQICNRNTDPLEGNTWGLGSFHGEDEDERNLYYQLIGRMDDEGDVGGGGGGGDDDDDDDESMGTTMQQQRPGRGFFVLDALEMLPASDVLPFQGILRAILQRLEVNRAPRPYILKLSALIRREATTAAPKRPAASSSAGATKRMR